MTLDEAIQQAVNLGEKDPLTIARKILAAHDNNWVATELVSLGEDILAERARKALGSVRRSAELVVRPGNMRGQTDLMLASFWVPGVGYKVAGDLTSSDFRARAQFYDVVERAAVRRAVWCREVADLMDAEKAKTLRKLKAELPALPEAEESSVLELEAV